MKDYRDDYIKKVIDDRSSMEDCYLRSFIEETKLLPSECEIVTQMTNTGYVSSVRKKERERSIWKEFSKQYPDSPNKIVVLCKERKGGKLSQVATFSCHFDHCYNGVGPFGYLYYANVVGYEFYSCLDCCGNSNFNYYVDDDARWCYFKEFMEQVFGEAGNGNP